MRYIPSPKQLSLFAVPYKYIIDSCAIISQNLRSMYPRSVHKGLWEGIDSLVKTHELVICKQIESEILAGKRDDEAKEWVKNSDLVVLEEDEFVQRHVAEVVNSTPRLLRFGAARGTSSGDAFIIATAIEYGLIIVSQERKASPYKIPQVASKFGIETLDINELAEREGWSFGQIGTPAH